MTSLNFSTVRYTILENKIDQGAPESFPLHKLPISRIEKVANLAAEMIRSFLEKRVLKE